MLFNSFQFAAFYLVVLVAVFSAPARTRWAVLLFASYVFYASWRIEYTLLLLAVTGVSFAAGLALGKTQSPRARKGILAAAVTAGLSLLGVFKYSDFALANAAATVRWLGGSWGASPLDLLLPLGISFFTFQAIGYVIDVYRGDTPVEPHLGRFALYVSFFPQLVAGPIERSYRLLPQLSRRTRLEAERIVSGLQSISWGLFKKIVIADRLAVAVDTVYAAPGDFSGPYLILATVFFAIQIYCDFSGYSDMAIGTARILGYDLMENFRRPYFAASLSEFWRRWHISLSTWFRDYVYKPLGGNRVSLPRWASNIMVVFLLSGIWHGANWTFVAWGVVHGGAMVLSAAAGGLREAGVKALRLDRLPRLRRGVQRVVLLSVVVSAWVFFRAETLAEALSILRGFVQWGDFSTGELWDLGLRPHALWPLLASVAVLFAVEWVQEVRPTIAMALWQRRGVRWAAYLTLLYGIILFGVFGQVEFIYFQF